jgi:hypothetical protein
MSTETIRLLIFGVLMVHGLGHGGALGALLWRSLASSTAADQAGWLAPRSWVFPSLPTPTATTVASAFWILSMLGFVAAALSFWGILVPGEAWRLLAIGSSIVSLVGITFSFGTWPPFNTLAALAVNVAVLVTQLAMHWPPQAMFGN